MPAKVTLFNALCKPVYDLGSGPYNLVRWNPFGRFFAICGFGNLPGEAARRRWGREGGEKGQGGSSRGREGGRRGGKRGERAG